MMSNITIIPQVWSTIQRQPSYLPTRLLYLNPDHFKLIPWYVSKAFEIGQEGREVFYTLVAKLQKK